MELEEVLRVLDRLDEAGVSLCVGGGWGVDALLGRPSRDHRDLDLLVDATAFEEAVETLAALGYARETDWLPVRLEVAAPGRGWVDLHPVDVDAGGHGVQQGPAGTTYEDAAGDRTLGTLGGRPVPCLTRQAQLRLHAGYDPRPQDRADLALLRSLDDD
ncbi:nucleotidyltransferase domain-containing protein [Nocardioides aestuarii]|uniref:Nucleotidyltransferase domain-containing protein n=1 Tax=Nocardioides aestuarii TaxID=252231 RepID=A0ABW4TTA3_9ACTN